MPSKIPTLTINDVIALFDQAKNQHAFFQADLMVQAPPKRLTGGVLNDVYKVETSAGSIIIKWYRDTQLDPSATATHEELFDLQKCLFEKKVSVPEPYAYLNNFRGNHVLVMEYIEGQSPTELNQKQAERIGALIANFHLATQKFPAFKTQPNDIKSFLSEIYQSICRGFSQRQPIRELSYLKTLFGYAFSTLWFEDNSKLPSGLRHADIHAGNILISEDIPYLLDFELCLKGAFIDDIANAICMFCLGHETKMNEALLSALLTGYQSIRPITAQELDYLPTAFKNRIGLERVGNLKLNNLHMPNGSNFTEKSAKTLSHYISSGQWLNFRRKLLPVEMTEQEMLYQAKDKRFNPYYQLQCATVTSDPTHLAANDAQPIVLEGKKNKLS
ncbi:phosphotransferase [Candidatus Berkiella cookevillensis]|uniref:Homoserine kinase n=1 Tax=Candidatus Berkiella cookevillensis TaxID=437022 RepID=A0A0Q9YRY5_9GAMM|nr:phosphotransferase [Candidatus Berkiella cookevillensis]MCS5709623.1 phosphotransferase [Candidatus Berkiella cookevillensis]